MKHTLTERSLAYLFLTLIALVAIIPLVIALFTSLKGDEEFSLGGMTLLPSSWHPENYSRAWEMADWGVFIRNSAIVTAAAVGGSLVLNLLAGFTFARIRFPGRTPLFLLLLLGLMIPAQVTVIPQFIIMKSIPLFGGNDWLGQGGNGWLDSYWALIVPELAGAFGVFMARQFYLQFPKALDDASYIDGAGYLRLFFSVYLPLSGPLLATLGIFKFVSVWNDFFHPLLYTNSPGMRTVQLGLQVFRGEHQVQYNLLMAASLLVSIPILIMFFVFQKQFIRSMVSTGVKG
ncbi:carbohydrate ABC transporter permease [Cohnella thailandensis]|uniref:Carbohydrate ABC transporter permease n=1 Tax=Cohnella thailandensis TaxID=557557 RepID=A0A841SSK2_9BACL|nr:carbohydrate ABC transporter permease [Cohnella thailandensis]MBB6634914.1 carbohydrate ABC transporter permease [Cohnella thailandensis]MBP1975864.1 multiple sugar transport system permease protein [Cohnella thailandensis]